MPKRIQRKRTKGWRMPAGTIYVGRGTRFGNPFRLPVGSGAAGAREVVDRYREHVLACGDEFKQEIVDKLRGKDLACWCPLDQPCHSDVLLELANREA